MDIDRTYSQRRVEEHRHLIILGMSLEVGFFATRAFPDSAKKLALVAV
jgi:hypothetical protein